MSNIQLKPAILLVIISLVITTACSNNNSKPIQKQTWQKNIYVGEVRHTFTKNDGSNLAITWSVYENFLLQFDNFGNTISSTTPFKNMIVFAAILLPSENLIVAGFDFKDERNIAVVAEYNLGGNEIWRSYPLGESTKSIVRSISKIQDGEYAVGITNRDNQEKVYISNLDNSGNVIVTHTHPITHEQLVLDLFVTSDQKYFVQTHYPNSKDGFRKRMQLFDYDGAVYFNREYDIAEGDEFMNFYEENDAYLLVGEKLVSGWAIRMFKDGTIDWEREVTPDGVTLCGYGDVVPSIEKDGYCFVGHKNGNSWIVFTDQKGQFLSENIIVNPEYDQISLCTSITSDSGYLIGGSNGSRQAVGEGFLLKVNSDGTLIIEE